jgi:hypothetical protein
VPFFPGASPYTPYNQYTYTMVDERKSRYREMRAEAGSFIQVKSKIGFLKLPFFGEKMFFGFGIFEGESF